MPYSNSSYSRASCRCTIGAQKNRTVKWKWIIFIFTSPPSTTPYLHQNRSFCFFLLLSLFFINNFFFLFSKHVRWAICRRLNNQCVAPAVCVCFNLLLWNKYLRVDGDVVEHIFYKLSKNTFSSIEKCDEITNRNSMLKLFA